MIVNNKLIKNKRPQTDVFAGVIDINKVKADSFSDRLCISEVLL